MSINEMLWYLNVTAAVLGYITLILLLTGLCWFVGIKYDAWVYKRRRQRKRDREFDNMQSRWFHEKFAAHRTDTVESHQVVVPSVDRTTTEEFPSTVDDIQTYWTEKDNHDAA